MEAGKGKFRCTAHNYYINTSVTCRCGPDRGEKKRTFHGAHGHCVTKVVLFVVGIRRGSDIVTWGSATAGSLCRSRSKDAGTAELRAESDDVDERIGEARFRTRGREGNEDGPWDCKGG